MSVSVYELPAICQIIRDQLISGWSFILICVIDHFMTAECSNCRVSGEYEVWDIC